MNTEVYSYKELPVDSLVPYARNSRTHSESQIQQLASSIKEFGFINPVILDGDNGILAGHGRILAAKRLGLNKVPTIQAKHLTEAQRRAYIIADNKLALNAGWDTKLLAIELDSLKKLDFDLSLTGFSFAELSELLERGGGLVDPDDVPEAEAEICQLGDVWELGQHRLACGDCTYESVVNELLGTVKPNLMVTDPPYGVDYDPKWRLDSGLNKIHQIRAKGKVLNDKVSDWSESWRLFPGDVAYIWHGGLHAGVVGRSLESASFKIRAQIIWAKPSLVIGRGHYHWQHEPCWYAVRGKGQWVGDRKQATIWQIANMHRTQGIVDDGKTIHSTQKPVECMKRPILNNSNEGQAVYDPFLGSGTTIIAAEMTNRVCYGIEINPKYCDVIITRWQNFTGGKAIKDGKTYEELKDAKSA